MRVAASPHHDFEVRREWFDELDSTSSEAFRRGMRGEVEGLWVAACHQTSGRGRRGHHWVSGAGNLHASTFLRSSLEDHVICQLSFVAAVALVDALVTVCPGMESLVHIKWPNDLLIHDRKLAGILVESYRMSQGEKLLVVGIGVNCHYAPGGLTYGSISLRDTGFIIDPDVLLAELAWSFDRTVRNWDSGHCFSLIRSRWLEYAVPVGKVMTVCSGTETLQGLFGGVDDDGSLLLQLEDGSSLRVLAGDVLF